MGKLNAGDLTERVTLLTTASVTEDGIGGSLPAGSIAKPVWANVRQLSGRQLVSIGQQLDQRAYSITIRYLNGVSAKQQLLYQGAVLSVQIVQADTRREYQVLICFDSGRYAPGPAASTEPAVTITLAIPS